MEAEIISSYSSFAYNFRMTRPSSLLSQWLWESQTTFNDVWCRDYSQGYSCICSCFWYCNHCRSHFLGACHAVFHDDMECRLIKKDTAFLKPLLTMSQQRTQSRNFWILILLFLSTGWIPAFFNDRLHSFFTNRWSVVLDTLGPINLWNNYSISYSRAIDKFSSMYFKVAFLCSSLKIHKRCSIVIWLHVLPFASN